MATIFAQRQIRLAAKSALEAANIVVVVDSPGDWNVPASDLPIIQLRSPGNRKEGQTKAVPQFTTTVTLQLQARAEATTADAAQDAIEDLGDRIEQALFTNYDLLSLVQAFSSVDGRVEISSEGKQHIASLSMSIDCELFETYTPVDPPALTSIGIHVDTGMPFDPTGTYANPPFPDAVQPAPRTSGPDGRDEGALDITLPQ